MLVSVLCTTASPVVRTDVKLLAGDWNTELVEMGKLPRLVAEIPRAVNALGKSDATIVWFAELPAAICGLVGHLIGKAPVVIVGGFELADAPEWGYGGRRGPLRRLVTLLALRFARKVIAVSPQIEKELLAIYPWIHPEVVLNGVDLDFFRLPEREERDTIVITVIHEGSSWSVKGVDRLLATAQIMPSVKFEIVGMSPAEIEKLGSRLPLNVIAKSLMSQSDLRRCYQRAKVACQLSRRESFGLALAEAMACGCIPVATKTGMMAEMTEGIGKIVDGDRPLEIAHAIAWALDSDLSRQARMRIEEKFPLDRRALLLKSIVFSSYNSTTFLPDRTLH